MPYRRYIVIDTEATSCKFTCNSMLQFSCLDEFGNVLYNRYFRPHEEDPLWPNLVAAGKTVAPERLRYAEDFRGPSQRIISLFASAYIVVGFNISFDLQLLRKEQAGIPGRKGFFVNDVQKILERGFPGIQSKYKDKTMSLSEWSHELGYTLPKGDRWHDAVIPPHHLITMCAY